MSARTFVEWQAYCSIEPFGPVADYWRAGMIAAMIANVNRKKNQPPYKPEDFMPKGMLDEPTPMSAEQRAQVLTNNFEAYSEAQKVTGQ